MCRGYTQGSASYRWLALGFVVPPLWGLSQENVLQTAHKTSRVPPSTKPAAAAGQAAHQTSPQQDKAGRFWHHHDDPMRGKQVIIP